MSEALRIRTDNTASYDPVMNLAITVDITISCEISLDAKLRYIHLADFCSGEYLCRCWILNKTWIQADLCTHLK